MFGKLSLPSFRDGSRGRSADRRLPLTKTLSLFPIVKSSSSKSLSRAIPTDQSNPSSLELSKRRDSSLNKSYSMATSKITLPRIKTSITKSATFSLPIKTHYNISKWNAQKASLAASVSTSTCSKENFENSSSHQSNSHSELEKPRNWSNDNDFVCAICLECLYRPRELTCGHAFCLTCLQSYANTCADKFSCPSCRHAVILPPRGVGALSRNLSLEHQLDHIRRRDLSHTRKRDIQKSDSTRDSNTRKSDLSQTKSASSLTRKICQGCTQMCNSSKCRHCERDLCVSCGLSHATELMKEVAELATALHSAKEALGCASKEHQMRFNKLEEKIKEALNIRREELTEKVESVRQNHEAKLSRLTQEVDQSLEQTFDLTIKQQPTLSEAENRFTSINTLLSSVSTATLDPKFHFDVSSLRLDASMDALPDAVPEGERKLSRTLSFVDAEGDADYSTALPRDRASFYRKKSTLSRQRWSGLRVIRPAGVAVCPWSGNVFVTASDSCKIHVFDVSGTSLWSFGRRGHDDGAMLCPIGVAFGHTNREIYITDKWKHCVHVFDDSGAFVRVFGSKGQGRGQFLSPEGVAADVKGNIYVADTCNDRVQILDSDGVFVGEVGLISSEVLCPGGRRYTKREFSEPVGVAVNQDGTKVFVADSGNHRIRVFDALSGSRVLMFGSRGRNKGQFESPESITVDNEGFVLVGDSGNGRVQIFRPNGRFVRCLGSRGNNRGEFGWVSGLALSKQGDLIVADFKSNAIATF